MFCLLTLIYFFGYSQSKLKKRRVSNLFSNNEFCFFFFLFGNDNIYMSQIFYGLFLFQIDNYALMHVQNYLMFYNFVCMHICTCAHTHTHTHTYTHIHTRTHTHTHTLTHTHSHIHTHIHTYTYIHTCTHTYTHTHIYIYIYTIKSWTWASWWPDKVKL